MSHSKHELRAFGLCLLAALGLTVFAAASAQATTGWLESGSFIAATKTFHAVIHPLAGGVKHEVLDTTIGANNVPVEKLCETLTTEDGLLFGTPLALAELAEGLITFKFTKCKTFIGGKEDKECKPKEPVILKAKFRAILHALSPIVGKKEGTHDNKTYLLFEPHEAGKPFTTIEFSEECILGAKIPITGDLVAECLNSKLEKNTAGTDYCLEDAAHHYIQEAPKELFTLAGKKPEDEIWDELFFGTRRMSLLGISDVLLSASGNTWGVHIVHI